jgi:hypothetical protein
VENYGASNERWTHVRIRCCGGSAPVFGTARATASLHSAAPGGTHISRRTCRLERRPIEEASDVNPDFNLDEDTIERSMAELSDEFAQRVGALADLFARWREPEVARKVIDSMIAGDGAAFRDLIDLDLPVPPLNKCIWLTEFIEKVVPIDTREVCRLRNDLSREERVRYVVIVLEFRRRGELPVMEPSPGADFVNAPIPPGPFLNALKAEGLVTCEQEQVGGGLERVIQKPKLLCF